MTPLASPSFIEVRGWSTLNEEWEETHAIPPGTEDLEPTPRGLLVTLESAAKPLRGTRRFWGGYVDDHVYLVNVRR